MQFEAILFDCDGVLVDSEPLTCGVLRDWLEENGWSMTLQECMDRFMGRMVREQRAAIEANTRTPFDDAWMFEFYQRRNAALQAHLQIMPGALAAVQAAQQHAHGRIACASGADRFKVEMQLTQVGLMPFFTGRVFSGHEMPRSKPAPDVYLAAMAFLQVPGPKCLVIEDTATGVTAGVAAGATVWALCPAGQDGSALLKAGASQLLTCMNAVATALQAA